MKKSICLRGTVVVYDLRRFKGQRWMRLTVRSDATLLVTAPRWVPNTEIERFVRAQARWILDQLEFRRDEAACAGNREEYLRYKERARALVHHRLLHFNRLYGFRWNRISIRNQRTMWGSCTEGGNLSFNYKLALLSPDLADYVIVHELCHLAELNHSPRFWALVARAVPDHAEKRKALNSARMTAYERATTQ